MKGQRQSAILDLIDREAIRSQEQLRRRLRRHGFDATQATLSRDIKELGLVKRAVDGAYQRTTADQPASERNHFTLHRALMEYANHVDRVQQLVIVRTGPGQAQPLALAIDQARLREVVGTLAGDDTILVISRDARKARSLARQLDELRQ